MDRTARGKHRRLKSLLQFSFLLVYFVLFITQAIEKLTQSIHELSEMLLVFIKQCDEIEFPNAVDSTQQLLVQHAAQKNELEQELSRIKT
jgi:hypothetical protein